MTRRARIIAERARGDQVADIAARHGVSRQYVYQCVRPMGEAQREARRAYQRQWLQANPEKVAKYRKRALSDPEKAARLRASNIASVRRHREKFKDDPEHRERWRLQSKRAKAKARAAKRRAKYMRDYMKRRRATPEEKAKAKAYDAARNATTKRKAALRARDREPLRRARQIHRKRLKRLLSKMERIDGERS